MSVELTLSELLGAMSHALDMTEGLPQGHSARASLIALAIADQLGLQRHEKRDLFYSVLLKDAGCSSNAARLCELYKADDLTLKRDFRTVGPRLSDTLRYVFSHTAPDQAFRGRAQAVLNIMRHADKFVTELIETRCQRGADIVRRLRFSEQVADAIASLDEHWNGAGKPLGLKGEAVPLYARIALLSQVAEVFHAEQGPAAAIAEVRRRSGTWFDPRLVDALVAAATPLFWRQLSDGSAERAIAAIDEGEPLLVNDDYLDDVAAAFADIVDAKTPWTAGHSVRVQYWSDCIAAELGLSYDQRRRLRRAALLHDVGKLGVSNKILEKSGKLDDAEWASMHSHPARSEAILSRIAAFADAAVIGGAHHERLDGKGYPRKLAEDAINLETRIVSVADVFDALTADRPYRAAMSREAAFAIIENDIGRAFDRDCVRALQRVLAYGNDEAAPLEIAA